MIKFAHIISIGFAVFFVIMDNKNHQVHIYFKEDALNKH